MERLETPRLFLRPWRLEDAEDMFEYACDPRVGPMAGWPVHETPADTLVVLKRFEQDDEVSALVLKESEKVIGSIGMHRRDPEKSTRHLPHREVGYCLNPSYWGQEFMPEAVAACLRYGFERLGLVLVWCGYYEGNDNSRRVAEKCGFSYRFSEYKPVELLGESRLEHYYALPREEWNP